MKQFNIKKKIKKAEVALILSALLATSPMKVKASNDDYLGCSYERMGEPEFLDELYDILNNIEPGFKAYFEANNLRVIIMEGEYSAEAMYENNIESIDFAITGFADNDLNTIYVESVIREDYYDKYLADDFKDYPRWIRNVFYPVFIDIGDDWTVWQYNDKGKLEGYEGETYIDFNVINMTKGGLDVLKVKK